MKKNIYFLMALLLVSSAFYAQTPDSVRVEMAPDTVVLSASADTVETVPHHSLWMGVPAEETSPTYKAPNLRYSNQVRVGNVSIERQNVNQKSPSAAEPNIPMTTPDGRTINSNSKAGVEFSIGWGK